MHTDNSNYLRMVALECIGLGCIIHIHLDITLLVATPIFLNMRATCTLKAAKMEIAKCDRERW